MPPTMTTPPTNLFTRIFNRPVDPTDNKTSDKRPCFEDSIGVEYRKIGRLHCWEAKGLVRRKFLNLKDHIKQHLEEHGDAVLAPVIWQVYIIGKSRSSAHPIVFFCSADANARKTIRKQIDDSNILANFPEFKTGDCARPLEFDQLKPLAADEAGMHRAHQTWDITCDNPIGRRVEIQQRNLQGSFQRRYATVGAIFICNGQLLFSTAAHAFVEHGSMLNFENDNEHDFELSFDEEAWDLDIDDFPECSGGEVATEAVQRPPEPENVAQDMDTYNAPTQEPDTQSPDASATFGLDDIVFSSNDGPNPTLDYCLVRLKGNWASGRERIQFAGPLCKYHVVQPTMRTDDAPRDAAVVAYTGSGSARRGMLSGTPSFMTLPGGNQTQELWSVRLDDTVAEGDCGSIIVNQESGNLEGHIVAGCPGSRNAYIIPAYTVLHDIRMRFSSQLNIWNKFSNCEQKPPYAGISSKDAGALTKIFSENLSEARKMKLSEARRKKEHSEDSGISKSGPLAHQCKPRYVIYNIPISPEEPQDARSIRFRSLLRSLSNRPFEWNNPGLLDEAVAKVPLEMLHEQAESEFESLRIIANAYFPPRQPILSFQDCLVRALLRWFKRSFFEWVDNPRCSHCGGQTTGIGMAAPLAEELGGGARAVEAYRCENRYCGNFERFPRYNDPFILMRTRRGRSGEWTQCFTMLCHAIGVKVRWVWNAEDHAWTEIYSEQQSRWIHVDAHAEAWDQPRIYCEGWGKKLSYCIAFSKEGATDVTRRYVRSQRFALDRKRASESELLHILHEIRAAKRKDMPAERRTRLVEEDKVEQAELQKFVFNQITQDLCKLDVAGTDFTYKVQLCRDGEREYTDRERADGNRQERADIEGERPDNDGEPTDEVKLKALGQRDGRENYNLPLH